MRTVVLRVDEPNPTGGAGCLFRLYFDDDGDSWQDAPVAALTVDPAQLQDLDTLRQVLLEGGASPDRFREAGERLYSLVFRGEVEERWRELRARFPREQQPSEGLRTVFDIRPAELSCLPWELLFAAQDRLFIDVLNPCVRGSIDAWRVESPGMWPIRLLVVVGAEASDANVEVTRELSVIQDVLREFRGRLSHGFPGM